MNKVLKKRFNICILIFLCSFLSVVILYRCLHKPILSGNYSKIDLFVSVNVELKEKENISLFVDYINKMYKRETLTWQEACQSPDEVIMLTRDDGTKEHIYIRGCFMYYNDKQYVINQDKFYDYMITTWNP